MSRSEELGSIENGEVLTASQRAASAIRERILRGHLKPGQKLNQLELATELSMSRIPVRDALRTLGAEGFVSLRENTTAVVAPLSKEDLLELHDIRVALEPALGGAAAYMITDSYIDSLTLLIGKMRSDVPVDEWLRHNNQFHDTLYQAAERPRTLAIVRQTRRHIGRYAAIYLELIHAHSVDYVGLDREIVNLEHNMILESVSDGQGSRVEALLAAHIASSCQRLVNAVESREEGQHMAAQVGHSRSVE